jgi:hypothetical protein
MVNLGVICERAVGAADVRRLAMVPIKDRKDPRASYLPLGTANQGRGPLELSHAKARPENSPATTAATASRQEMATRHVSETGILGGGPGR